MRQTPFNILYSRLSTFTESSNHLFLSSVRFNSYSPRGDVKKVVVLVVPKLAIRYVPPKTLNIFDVAPKLVPCTELVIIGR